MRQEGSAFPVAGGGKAEAGYPSVGDSGGWGGEVGPSDASSSLWDSKVLCPGAQVPHLWPLYLGQAFSLLRPITREPGSHLALAPDPSPLGGSGVGPTTHMGDWD